MTDFEKFVDMARRANLDFDLHEEGKELWLQFSGGYIGFISYIIFNQEGFLLRIEAYE